MVTLAEWELYCAARDGDFTRLIGCCAAVQNCLRKLGTFWQTYLMAN